MATKAGGWRVGRLWLMVGQGLFGDDENVDVQSALVISAAEMYT